MLHINLSCLYAADDLAIYSEPPETDTADLDGEDAAYDCCNELIVEKELTSGQDVIPTNLQIEGQVETPIESSKKIFCRYKEPAFFILMGVLIRFTIEYNSDKYNGNFEKASDFFAATLSTIAFKEAGHCVRQWYEKGHTPMNCDYTFGVSIEIMYMLILIITIKTFEKAINIYIDWNANAQKKCIN